MNTLEQINEAFDKDNLELMLKCIKKYNIIANIEYGGQVIYFINSFLEVRENQEMIQRIFDVKFIDFFLEILQARKIEESILRFLFYFKATIVENHVIFFLNEYHVIFNYLNIKNKKNKIN